jgi:hypothetical protein
MVKTPSTERSRSLAIRRSAAVRHALIISAAAPPCMSGTQPKTQRETLPAATSATSGAACSAAKLRRSTVSSSRASGTRAERSLSFRVGLWPVRSSTTPPTQETAKLAWPVNPPPFASGERGWGDADVGQLPAEEPVRIAFHQVAAGLVVVVHAGRLCPIRPYQPTAKASVSCRFAASPSRQVSVLAPGPAQPSCEQAIAASLLTHFYHRPFGAIG